MDNITQWVIWWSLYTLITGKRSNKQFRLGAGIANIPDLDVFVGRLLPLSPIDAQFFHRGIMHSIIFNIGVSLALWYILYRSDKTVSYWRYVIGVFVSILFWHLLVDGMTSYGMRYWLPFSGKTYSSDNIFVVDFGMWIITIAWLIWYMISQAKEKIAKYILIAVWSYFALTFMIQWYVDHVFVSHYPQRMVPIKVIDSHTIVEPLQPFLWRHIAKTSVWYYEGYYSLFDANKNINREFVSSNKKGEQLLKNLSQQDNHLGHNIRQIESFARGMLRVTQQWSGYIMENMMFWPLLGRQTGQQERMFNFTLQPQWSGYILQNNQSNRSDTLNSQLWNSFWNRVFWYTI
jgi:membrane-bound metal-dependent hydrolase YbcI (DUF457 family)